MRSFIVVARVNVNRWHPCVCRGVSPKTSCVPKAIDRRINLSIVASLCSHRLGEMFFALNLRHRTTHCLYQAYSICAYGGTGNPEFNKAVFVITIPAFNREALREEDTIQYFGRRVFLNISK